MCTKRVCVQLWKHNLQNAAVTFPFMAHSIEKRTFNSLNVFHLLNISQENQMPQIVNFHDEDGFQIKNRNTTILGYCNTSS